MEKLNKKKSAVLNVSVDKRAFERIISGEQKVVFEFFERKAAITKWYGKCYGDFNSAENLVIKVWCEARRKGNKNAAFICTCIWDSDNWSWFGWLPDDKSYDEFDEPGEDHFVLYLGDQLKFAA